MNSVQSAPQSSSALILMRALERKRRIVSSQNDIVMILKVLAAPLAVIDITWKT